MNIFYVALLLCLVSHVYGSEVSGMRDDDKNSTLVSVEVDEDITKSRGAQLFREAVDGGDMWDAMMNVYYRGSDQLKKYCGKYLAQLEATKLVGFIKSTKNDIVKGWILKVLLIYADLSLFDAVFGDAQAGKNVLKHLAWSAELASKPDRFVYLLSKITDRSKQVLAVRNATYALVDGNKVTHVDGLLPALKKGKFLNEDLENIAIGYAFLRTSKYNDDNR
jgi:hypothetical protein